MPQPLAEALALPGLWVLGLAAVLAGLVRGFSGFGSGLVYMPIAGAVLSPAQAVAVLVVMDLLGPLANLPGALRTGTPREIGLLGLGMLPGLPLGVAALFLVDPSMFRWSVSLIALATVAALVAGWRWHGPRGRSLTMATGFMSGLVGGATALPGPPVILYYMASPLPIAQVRANLTMFLLMVDLGLVSVLGASGQLSWALATVSLMLLVPFSLANGLGSALFRPERARAYRLLSWGLIAASAIAGLPFWKG
ncbi:sulfite exporter TauE/SafE family protein [Gemmobacter nectariphilus]|uniref:sulfite exporter TauE/SafE family protein n=1 Tax=Gemmobacter nectariphilus TaxID=220343 RepID=UPI0003FA9650|nr:sulfite exporter TauE/SafE family protein [Gemmobacter nectariphilus]